MMPPPPPPPQLHWSVGRPPPLSSFSCLSWTTGAPSRGNSRVRVRTPSSSSLKGSAIETEILPNALRRRSNPIWSGGGFSLGVDLGASRTGLAIGKGYASPRPLTVLELRGQKLEMRLLEIAEEQEVDEFIIGLPRSHDGKETVQSNKVRSVAGRIAVQAAERSWRVYLQDEHGSSMDALDYMIDLGLKKSARREKIDSYSAIMVLKRYFSISGEGAELVLPKQLELQEKLLKGCRRDLDF